MFLPLLLLGLFLLESLVSGNAEKTIFVTPEAQDFPSDASLDNLLLKRLTLAHPSLRTHLNASFPTNTQPRGTETWMLLEDLTPGQRHEVRVCWLATQPTSFWIYTHTMQSVFENPSLISALTLYSNNRQASISPDDLSEARSRNEMRRNSATDKPTTFLFLQIYAAADYYSLNKTLMDNVPPVHADVILDPYLLDIFPQSLLPTAVYIICIAVFGWFASGWVYSKLIKPLAEVGTDAEAKKLQ